MKFNRTQEMYLILVLIALSNLGVNIYILCVRENSYFFSAGLTAYFDDVARNLKNGRGFIVNADNVIEVQKWQSQHRRLLDTSEANIAKTESIYPSIYSGPAYSILLCLTYFIKQSYWVVRVVQSVLFIVGCLLLFLITKKFFHYKTAVIASLLMAANPIFAANSIKILPEAIVPLTLIIAVFLYTKGEEYNSMRYFIFTGLVVGISMLFRPDVMLLPIFFLLVLAIRHKKRYWKYISVLIISSYLTILPWTIRNYTVFKKIVPISTGAGWVMTVGIGSVDNRLGDVGNDTKLTVYEREKFPFEGDDALTFNSDPIGRDQIRTRRIFKEIISEPLWYMKVLAKKIPRLLRSNPFRMYYALFPHEMKKEFSERTGDQSLLAYIKTYPLVSIVMGLWWGLLLLGTLGVYFLRKNLRNSFLLLVIPIYYILTQINFYPQWFYYFPSVAFISIFCAVAISTIIAKIKEVFNQGL